MIRAALVTSLHISEAWILSPSVQRHLVRPLSVGPTVCATLKPVTLPSGQRVDNSLKLLQPNPYFPLTLCCLARMSVYPFVVEYDKRGAAKCKKCKEKCEKGTVRIGKYVTNPFSESGGPMKQWYHVTCIFETFKRARATTKKIDDPMDDLEGWAELEDNDKNTIRNLADELQTGSQKTTPKKQTPKAKGGQTTPSQKKVSPNLKTATPSAPGASTSLPVKPAAARSDPGMDRSLKDNSFREFRRLCALIADEASYLGKTKIVSDFLKQGTSKNKFEGDLRLWVKLLLPGVVKRVYNLQSKQIIKLFSQLFNTNQEDMLEDLEQGDVAETIRKYFELSSSLPPAKKAVLAIHDVDDYLNELTGYTKEEEQSLLLKKVAKKCTGNDLKMFVRLIKGDLRINAGAKHILEAIHPDAYEAFQTTRNIDSVLDKILAAGDSEVNLKMMAEVMTPVLPMLAEACKSVDYAFKKCPSGAMYAEIKYDGERVQVHKKGSQFLYFSRSLKPVMPHKVSHFKNFIPKAFPHGSDLILDAEVLMISTKTGNPLPFGTLGVHKKAEFQDANVCLFVFDCLHYNGKDLMGKSVAKRREILEQNMTEIKNHVMFSEMKEIRRKEDLQEMISRVLKQGLEGLVLKDVNSIYEPGKRHWLKVKKDYLHDGAMADSADLVVLGAWYGTGKKGGMKSVFLMGCFDPRINKWCTVTKVHTGHDDAALERLQEELGDMVKISQDADRVPPWLKCTKTMVPDFVAADPKKSPVWEITGAEFTKHQIHTADGISIRFPRVTKVRSDKTWQDATNLPLLQDLYKKSRECADFEALALESEGGKDDDEDSSKGSSRSSSPVKGLGAGTHSASASPSSRNADSAKPIAKKNLFDKFQIKGDEAAKANKDKKNGKRKSEEAEDNPKKLCKYGAKCHNETSSHRLAYKHPATPAAWFPPPPTSNPLPDVFVGLRVSLPDNIKDLETLKRYVIAFGGDVVPSYLKDEATHIILPDKAGSGSSEREVGAAWLWDSIKLKKLQPTRCYRLSS